MITITNKTINIQAEFQTESLKLVGNATIEQNGIVTGFSGSIFKKEQDQEWYLGSFSVSQNVSINIDDRENAPILGAIANAATTFIEELQQQFTQEGGVQ